MTVKAIIHTATRVVMIWTIEDNPDFDVNVQTVVDLGVPQVTPPPSPTGHHKLDLANNIIPATDQDVADARVDPIREAIRLRLLLAALNNAIDDIADNGATLVKLRTYFQRLQALR